MKPLRIAVGTAILIVACLMFLCGIFSESASAQDVISDRKITSTELATFSDGIKRDMHNYVPIQIKRSIIEKIADLLARREVKQYQYGEKTKVISTYKKDILIEKMFRRDGFVRKVTYGRRMQLGDKEIITERPTITYKDAL